LPEDGDPNDCCGPQEVDGGTRLVAGKVNLNRASRALAHDLRMAELHGPAAPRVREVREDSAEGALPDNSGREEF
jgi:hypothetical protein